MAEPLMCSRRMFSASATHCSEAWAISSRTRNGTSDTFGTAVAAAMSRMLPTQDGGLDHALPPGTVVPRLAGQDLREGQGDPMDEQSGVLHGGHGGRDHRRGLGVVPVHVD